MEKSERVSEPERRDWGIILVILLIGFLCVIVAGSWALRFSPSWQLDTDMGSNIDPNRDFLTNKPQGFIEPVDAGILTAPGWFDLFLTPGALFATGTPLPPPPPATSTIPGTIAVPATFTPVTASPTNTLVWIPLPPTSTKKPKDPPTNTPIPDVDLQITMTDNQVSYIPGGIVIYTVTVTNNSTATVNNVPVLVTLPIEITAASWTCFTAGGATCTPGSGLSINDTVNLPAGAFVTYTITADVPAVSNPLSGSAFVTTPAPFTDLNPGNNTAAESTAVLTSDLNIGAGDGSWTGLGPGSSITMVLSTPITGGSGPDLVYYERYAPPLPSDHVDLDAVQILISSDGVTWHQVFYWGGGGDDTNTNVDVPIDACITEVDNCSILDTSLYNFTGIAIDIDSLGLSGSYPWIRITSPGAAGGDTDGGCDIDAIEIL